MLNMVSTSQIEIGTGQATRWLTASPRLRLVREWAQLHPMELSENWALAQALEPLVSIELLP